MMEFIYQHIQYPPEAIENKVEGKVIIKFIVERDGSMDEMKIVRGPGYGIDKEALRVVELMANTYRWMPGTSRGQAKRVQISLHINFSLPEQEK